MKRSCTGAAIVVSALLGCSLQERNFQENAAPVLASIRDRSALVGDLIGVSPSATDANGNALSFSVAGWMTETTKVALSSDIGGHTVTVSAGDGLSFSSVSFTVSVGNYTWAGVAPTVGFTQANLQGHSAVYDPVNKRMVVFGGVVSGTWYLNDASSLSLTSNGLEYWWDLTVQSCVNLPSRRAHHTGIYDPLNQRMIMFGGEVYTNPTTKFMNDAWVLSFTETTDGRWCPLSTSGTKPAPRSRHSAVLDPANQRMIVFGGTEFTTSTPKCNSSESFCIFGDLWALNLTSLTWQEIAPPQPRPSPRRGHTAVYDLAGKQMVVFGGRACPTTACAEANDVWALDLSVPGKESWKQISPEGEPPDARQAAAGAYMPGSGKIIIVGGNAGPVVFNDVWFLNLERPTWGRMYPDGPNFTARTNHTMIYDTYNPRLIVFGGLDVNGQGLQDIWSLK